MPRTCGFNATYRNGCRCDLCKAAHAANQSAYFERVGGNKHRKPEVERAHNQRRRARKTDASAELFDAVEVFERDDWTCGICLEPIDRELRFPHKMSASLDHVVPLSRGGVHTRANARPAHLTCNARRGAGDVSSATQVVAA